MDTGRMFLTSEPVVEHSTKNSAVYLDQLNVESGSFSS